MAAGGGGCVDAPVDKVIEKSESVEKTVDDMKPRKKLFTIKKWNAVGYWSYNIVQDTCAICRFSIYDPSIHNQSIGSTEINIGWGVCNHCFHIECISKWLVGHTSCPLCGNDWEYQTTRCT